MSNYTVTVVEEDYTVEVAEGAKSLAGLADVVLLNPAEAQVLTFDEASGKWVNGAAAGGAADIGELTAAGFDAGDFSKWDGGQFVGRSPVEVLADIGAMAGGDAWTLHIPGTLAADVNVRFVVPVSCRVTQISAGTSNNSDAEILFGVSGDTDSILVSSTIGDSNVPRVFSAADWAGTNPTAELAAGQIAALTVNYDGASGTPATDLTVVITTTGVSVGAADDVADLTGVGFAADDLVRWNGSLFVKITPAGVRSLIEAQAASAKLTVLDGLTWAANSIFLMTGAATAAVQALASHVVTFLGSANAVAARSAIGAGTGNGDVTAASNITDNAVVRGDGGAKGVQTSGVTIDDNGVMEFLSSSVIYGSVSGQVSKLVLRAITPGTAFRPLHLSGIEIVFLFNDVAFGKRVKFTSVGATPQTVIPNGAGDVTAVISGTFTIQDSAGNVGGGVITATAPSGSFNLYTDGGTNVCQLQVAADGSVTVVRTAGSRTYTVNLNLNWL